MKYMRIIKKNIIIKKYKNNKDKNGKYFYSYCDIKNNNNNNYNTEKKYIRTSQYYH